MLTRGAEVDHRNNLPKLILRKVSRFQEIDGTKLLSDELEAFFSENHPTEWAAFQTQAKSRAIDTSKIKK